MGKRTLQLLFFFFVLAFLGKAFEQLFLFPYIESGDGLSLFNPVYMGKYYHRIVYPAYYYFDNMPVHPPVYYWFMSLLYRIGLPVFYVIKLPVFLALGLFGFSMFFSKLNTGAKFTGLLAITAAIDSTGAFITFRPDIVLSVTFLASLVCLHNGTRNRTKPAWLLMGSVLIGVSSTLHYFGVTAVAGLVFFSKKIWQHDSFDRQWKLQFALLFPAALIMCFYMSALVFPNLRDIGAEVMAASLHTKHTAIQAHYIMYSERFGGSWFFFLLQIMPGVCWILLGSWFNKDLRLICLAAIPLVLFVFLVPAGKTAGYYIVEWTLLLWLFYNFCWETFQFIIDKTQVAGLQLPGVVVLILVVSYVTCFNFHLDRHAAQVNIEARANGCEMFTARACGKAMLGNDAKVGGRLNVWFNSGAAHYYQISRNMSTPDSNSAAYYKRVFATFDALAEYRQGADISYWNSNYSLSQWYAEGVLSLKGFYLSNNYKSVPYNQDNDAPYLLFCSEQQPAVTGYKVYNNDEIISYKSDSLKGQFVFLSFVAKGKEGQSLKLDSIFEMYTAFIFPGVSSVQTKTLIWGIATKSKTERHLSSVPENLVLRDLIPLQASYKPKQELLGFEDKPVKFYRTLANFQSGKSAY